ncbi:Heat shock 70 kDa protein 13 [Lemmus lemmus]
MAYGLHKVDVFYVLVVDLGGGTLDVSLLNKQGGMFLTRAMSGKNNTELMRLKPVSLICFCLCSEDHS